MKIHYLAIAVVFLAACHTAFSQDDPLGELYVRQFLEEQMLAYGGQQMNAVQTLEKIQQTADRYYDNRNYKRAFPVYVELAQNNDKFSQYRLATMYATAKGTDQDLPLAYAWSRIAAETREKNYVNYHVKLTEFLDEQQLRVGKEEYKTLLNKYGTFALVNRAKKYLAKGKRECAGSRVGSSCDKVQTLLSTCSVRSDYKTGEECLTFGAIGVPSLAGLHPTQLNELNKRLDKAADQFQPGEVIMRDMELIE